MNYKVMELSPYEKTVFRAACIGFGVIVGWLFYDNFGIGIIVGILLFLMETSYKLTLLEKRKTKLLSQFKDFMYSLASSISSGRSIAQAMEESIEFWQGTYDDNDYIIKELKSMSKKIKESNIPAIEELRDFAYRTGLEDAEDLVMICETCKTTGGDFAKAINKGADIIGDKITLEKELKTIMSQKKFEGRLVALAPFVLILFIKILSPSYLEPLTMTGPGRVVSTISLVLIIIGVMSIERMNNVEI